MNSQPNRRRMMDDPDQPPPQGAFPVWSRVLTKPGEQTFLEVTAHPDATAKNAYVWVFVAGTLSGLIGSLVQLFAGASALRQMMPEFDQIPGLSTGFGLGGFLGAICTAPLTGVFSVIGFAVSVALIHWVALFLGGKGNFDRLAYAFGAIVTPVTVITSFLAPLSLVPFAGFCVLPLTLLLGLYALYLQIAAVKAVHGFSWLEALIAEFLPVILLGFLCAFAVLGLMRSLGPMFNEILQQLGS